MGAFAPIHKGHVEAARAFIEQMWLDVLFVVPTCKHDAQDVSGEDRIECCRIAFRDIDGVIVSDMALKRGDKDSISTLRELSEGGERRLFMLCGSDEMLTLDSHGDVAEIFKLCYPVYARRENDRSLDARIIAKNTEYFEKYGRYVIKLDAPVTEISSGEIRRMIKDGEDVSAYVDSEVLKYINEKELYR